MQVDEFYEQILGIESPWEIADVRLDRVSSVVQMELAHAEGLREASAAGAIASGLMLHEWLATREWLWLNDKNAVVGMSNINPLLQKKAKVNPLKLPKAKLGVAGATPKPFRAMVPVAFNSHPSLPFQVPERHG